ncbi:hypothetical protein DYB37_010796 [Aphanomyces astaci]|uniref:DDE Tnp4 domain-containing protein n=1 Tax=Aphanomyces astaci TaxID=112090 RepID=A0A418DBQ1_APHAT|nr:hypothetical protein DYB35_010569 [Aphanomyces astaci]RHZ14610.1 hypothetical protein DYB37_010796 [Aphanomyces astaci]
MSDVLSSMASSWIHLPRSHIEWRHVEHGFKLKNGMVGVVGAIDGTLIEILRPRLHEGFYNRHGDTSLNIQAVVDSAGSFMSVDMRPGSFSDKKIRKLSELGNTFRANAPKGCYIIGDSGYSLFPWLMVPYLQHEEGWGPLNPRQAHFNYALPSTRMAVECAFGRLKERFRVLKGPMTEERFETTVKHVMSCMVLHNMIQHMNDPLFDGEGDDSTRNDYCQPIPTSKRNTVETDGALRGVATYRRDKIAQALFKLT